MAISIEMATLTIESLAATVSADFTLGPIDLSVQTGEIVVVLGENGSGKTSLFRALLGELPASGTAKIDGIDLLSAHPQERARRVALVPQTEEAPFHFSVLETVLMGCMPSNPARWESDLDHDAAQQALESVGIAHLGDRPVSGLSGGERQKALIARAIAQNPKLLLLDEPTAHIDLKSRATLKALIADLSQTRAVIATTHDLAWGTAVADRCLVMQHGKCALAGRPEELEIADLEEIFQTPLERTVQVGDGQKEMGRIVIRPVD